MSVLMPATPQEAAAALADATRARRRVRIVGGGTHTGVPRPAPAADVRMETRRLDRLVEHTPADLTVTVEAGHDAQALAAVLARHGQWWPQADIRPGSTVGGILAAAASGERRLREGPVRDSLLEVVVATGDGRLITGGGRTVKNVSGFDLPRLMVGARGTLGVIVQVTLKLWPLPAARAWTVAGEGEPVAAAIELAASPLRPAVVVLTGGTAFAELMGAAEDAVAPPGWAPDASGPPHLPAGAGLLAVGVPPTRVPALVEALDAEGIAHRTQAGVGASSVRVEDAGLAHAVRGLAAALGGHAVLVADDGAVGDGFDPFGPDPAGLVQMRRLRDAFDPAGILNPGWFVGDPRAMAA